MPSRHRTSGPSLGLALLGCGEIGVRNARAASASGTASIRWAVDPDESLARDLARTVGARATPRLSEALEDREVEAVMVCAPHHLHAPLAMAAIEARKHVLVEKPTARTFSEAKGMADAADRAGVRLTTFYPMRFLPQVRAARRLIESGALGKLQSVAISEHIYKEMRYWFGGASGRSRSNWRASKELSGGGVILMNLCHHLELMGHLTGLRPVRVYCDIARHDAPGDVEDLASMTIRMSDGVIVSVDAGTATPGRSDSRFEIRGSDGQIALDDPPRFLSLHRSDFGMPNEWQVLPRGGENEARRSFLEAFAHYIRAGDGDPAPRESSLSVLALIDSAYASAAHRKPVEIAAHRERDDANAASDG